MVGNPRPNYEPINIQEWICPDLRTYYKLLADSRSNRAILQAISGNNQFQFSSDEGYALKYFTGKFTIQQIQTQCSLKLTNTNPNLVAELLKKLLVRGIITFDDPISSLPSERKNHSPKSILKPGVQWFKQSDDCWVVRNPETSRFMLFNELAKTAIDQLGHRPTKEIAQEVGEEEFRYLLQQLKATGMLEGSEPPQTKRGKFTPLQLLSFKVPLGNPDPWLTRHVDKVRWLLSATSGFCLSVFLAFTAIFSLDKHNEIINIGKQLWSSQGIALILPLGLLSMLVITLHELGHAFTLKHYGSRVPKLDLKVPEVGLMFMCLMPAAYVNTSDLYCLNQRYQRILVVAAGVLVQLLIAAFAFWLWLFSDNWLKNTSYLLLVASLLTVALNLNPLAKFDGYYLAVTCTGILNLRSRSRNFYNNLLRGKPTDETFTASWILAAYAPLSLAYVLSVFGFLLYQIVDWSLASMPMTMLSLLLVWAIYFYFPDT